MKKYRIWYEYSGMETEGRVDTFPEMIIEAEDIHEAVWKYPYLAHKQVHGTLENFRKEVKAEDVPGWGLFVKEIK